MDSPTEWDSLTESGIAFTDRAQFVISSVGTGGARIRNPLFCSCVWAPPPRCLTLRLRASSAVGGLLQHEPVRFTDRELMGPLELSAAHHSAAALCI